MSSASQSLPEANWQAEAHVGAYGYDDRPTGWASWITFAGVMLVLIGLLSAMEGVTALVNDDFYVVRADALLVAVGFTTWGWVHLVLGVVGIVTGAGLMRGVRLARVVAVVFAVVSALVHLAFLPAYPVWSTLVIAFDVVVIYAVTVHGQEVASPR
ncbi:DUF7144 family membrane protein [Geodermatophilus sabuli]|uniref:DUF7144 domain-containing protein n=1 Tax=Geodermatophilus sabuli TaxID=1564158 RepID=A0A285EIB6_9ACTN|nr:hypothetical protein [Geodermatophilus sabuli]MBB3086762.1 hypothetical protein [Geodermatophilus sabuli]SNX98862.1 hypothetical protein SAMN06893097_112158 [Geodermatophilus sabuli]